MELDRTEIKLDRSQNEQLILGRDQDSLCSVYTEMLLHGQGWGLMTDMYYSGLVQLADTNKLLWVIICHQYFIIRAVSTQQTEPKTRKQAEDTSHGRLITGCRGDEDTETLCSSPRVCSFKSKFKAEFLSLCRRSAVGLCERSVK